MVGLAGVARRRPDALVVDPVELLGVERLLTAVAPQVLTNTGMKLLSKRLERKGGWRVVVGYCYRISKSDIVMNLTQLYNAIPVYECV